jgi:hypothetical protein
MEISSLGKIRLFKEHTCDVVFSCKQEQFQKNTIWFWSGIRLMIGLVWFALVLPNPGWSQTEATSKIIRYREREVSSHYYEIYEAKPRPYPVFVRGGIPQKKAITLSPIAEKVRRRQYLADSHWGLKFYERLTCIRCHPRQARNLHKRRAKITCRQCHGPEPIAGLKHYYSKMSRRRRHAFICAKCHEGATVSFATYVVHEPDPTDMSTRKGFPLLFYVFWMMAAIAVGTFAAFWPHAFMWGLREFLPDNFASGLSERLVKWRNPDGKD